MGDRGSGGGRGKSTGHCRWTTGPGAGRQAGPCPRAAAEPQTPLGTWREGTGAPRRTRRRPVGYRGPRGPLLPGRSILTAKCHVRAYGISIPSRRINGLPTRPVGLLPLPVSQHPVGPSRQLGDLPKKVPCESAYLQPVPYGFQSLPMVSPELPPPEPEGLLGQEVVVSGTAGPAKRPGILVPEVPVGVAHHANVPVQKIVQVVAPPPCHVRIFLSA